MRCFFTLLFMYALVSCSLHSRAQSNHVYVDSAILFPEEETIQEVTEEQQISAVTTETREEYGATNYPADTFLVNNRHFLSADSFRLLQNDKQFLYAKNLDSLLKRAKELEEEKERKRQENNEGSSSSDDRSSGPSFMERLFKSAVLQYVLWGMAGLFVLFVIYKLAFTEGGFRSNRANGDKNVRVVEEDLTPIPGKSFDAAIAKAKNEKNYRLAVRYLYLQLLQRLTAAGAIEFAVDKTNTEYLRELNGKPYKEGVAELTRYYDYVWYGEFEVDAALYAKVESKFINLVI